MAIGLIFDMDQTLAETGMLWNAAEVELFGSLGRSFDETLAHRYRGMHALDVATVVHGATGPDEPLAAFQGRFRRMLIEQFRRGTIRPVAGAVDLVRRLQPLGPMAVASGSPAEAIELVLNKLGIADAFAAIVSSEDAPRGKPAPDVFLAAAGRIAMPPARCVVFEDSLIGVQAAKAAGMTCLAVPSHQRAAIAGAADRVFQSWSEVTAEDVTALLAED